jgi:hypothetical protein
MRGGIVGITQMGLFKHLVTVVDRPNTSNPMLIKDRSQNEKIREFIGGVQDGNELLYRLALTGYFD